MYVSYLAYVAVSCCREGVVGPLGLGNLGTEGSVVNVSDRLRE